jgi:predicted ABC-type transport system involved in lysophospholipase L1 biosynthesis ATPase subunit
MAISSRQRSRPRRRAVTASVTPSASGAAARGNRSVIEFQDVSKLYAGDVGLEHASFSIQRGEFVFLVGSTGSGKSTVMRLLIKELEPTDGTIAVAGHDLGSIARKRVPYFRRNVGVVFQDFKLLPNRTVYDNVAYALKVTGGTRKEIRAKVPDILRLTGLSTKLHNLPTQLSGGEQPRVRQPSAAAARRRADRQPRPRYQHRHHATAVPDQPDRHDGRGGHPRLDDGRQDAPPRARTVPRADRARRGRRPLHRR